MRIIVKITDLTSLIRQRATYLIRKEDPSLCCLYVKHLTVDGRYHFSVKEEKGLPANITQKQADRAVFISDKITSNHN